MTTILMEHLCVRVCERPSEVRWPRQCVAMPREVRSSEVPGTEGNISVGWQGKGL